MNETNNKLTGWPAILEVLSKGGSTFLVLVVLAGVLYLESQERAAASQDRGQVIMAVTSTLAAIEIGLNKTVEVQQAHMLQLERLDATLESLVRARLERDK